MSTATTVTFEIPPPADSAFLWRRAFLGALRSAIAQAQIEGRISAATAVECFQALPEPADSAA